MSWGYSSAGRALEWHSRGQRFDPAYLHQGTQGKGLFQKERAFFVCVFRRLAYPGHASHASTLPHGAFRLFERPFFHAHF